MPRPAVYAIFLSFPIFLSFLFVSFLLSAGPQWCGQGGAKWIIFTRTVFTSHYCFILLSFFLGTYAIRGVPRHDRWRGKSSNGPRPKTQAACPTIPHCRHSAILCFLPCFPYRIFSTVLGPHPKPRTRFAHGELNAARHSAIFSSFPHRPKRNPRTKRRA